MSNLSNFYYSYDVILHHDDSVEIHVSVSHRGREFCSIKHEFTEEEFSTVSDLHAYTRDLVASEIGVSETRIVGPY